MYVCTYSSLVAYVAGVNAGGGGVVGKGEGEKRTNACYKNLDIRITASEFLVIIYVNCQDVHQ